MARKVDTLGRSAVKKRGSKVIEPCPVCGKRLTKAGLIGHLRFKHGRDHKAPMIPIVPPELAIVRAKATLRDAGVSLDIVDSGDACSHLLSCPTCKARLIAGLFKDDKAELIAGLRAEGYTVTEPRKLSKVDVAAIAALMDRNKAK